MVFLMKIKNDQKEDITMNENFGQIRATDLSAMLFKDSSKTPSQLERDAGFCSGGSEIGDDYQSERIQSSPSSTEASEDSVDIKFASIVIPTKRKTFDKSDNEIPLKKRFKFESVFDDSCKTEPLNPAQREAHHPWTPEKRLPNEAEVLARHPGVTTLHRVPADVKSCQDDQPLALVTKKSTETTDEICTEETPIESAEILDELKSSSRSTPQRNYKNMTRERRIEANARERTRVHTISAAFDTLRQAIPSYSNTQKLSKLSILRVACSYILTLSRMTGQDYSEDQSAPSVQSCLDEIAKTIQTEGKARKRKDD